MDEETPTPSLRPPLQRSASPRDLEPDERDIEKIRKWQQERVAKKLRGEYESAITHLSEVINSNLTTPSQIASVRIEGAPHTRPSFLRFLIDPLIPPPSPANDLETALHSARHIADVLKRTDIFNSVDAKLERAKAPLAGKHDVDLVFATKEKGRFFVKSSTEVGNNEGSASIVARVRNVFGGAETFEANLSLGTTTRKAFNATLTAPLTSNLNTYGEMHVFGLERDHSSFASCTEGLRGAKALLRSGHMFGGMHEFAYEAVLRHLGGLKPDASLSIREAAGQSIKSSVSHTFVLDNRNDRLTPTHGFYFKTVHELAGLGGDASFLKSETHGQISRPIFPGVSVSLAARSGLLWGLNGRTMFSDRFQLGGPVSIRSFRANAMGPRDGSDSVGGELYWAAGLSVISKIPKKPDWPIKTHIWVNAGRLDNIDQSRPLSDSIAATLTKPSVSAGVGLIYNFDIARVELNFGLPLVASKSDGSRRGLQVGLGLEFL
ncbi:surface antigen-domain-containing protein [Roridomyces roridus]|uniref:Surface antigen-domain-containing protein n=1 Tax=Roridomyces roridus TaxID=1738132 RepID=A0AAD7C2C6_9AGAR|nr:surface antigen-domain-containing protein [Roridomyces roridus]